MEHYKYVILGAGPSGLAFAHTLRLLGEESFVVLEKENEAGGLCRSVEVDGKPLDIGGGHFLDLKRQEVLDLVFRFMPREEWNEHQRVSKIRIWGVELEFLHRFARLLDGDQLCPLTETGRRLPPSQSLRVPGQHARQAAGRGNGQSLGSSEPHCPAGATGST